MNTIEQMIHDLCPEGVKRVRLGEVCEILDSQRRPVAKGQRTGGIYPYYGANGIQDYVDSYLFDGTFLLIGEDGSVINKDNSPILNWAEGKIWVNNHAHILSEQANKALLRYLFYALQCTDVSDIVRGTPPKLNQANLRDISIPLPPLEIQGEIVKILDRFAVLTAEQEAELEAELEARRKQYEYYRTRLLSFDADADSDTVQWRALGEVAQVLRGRRLTKAELLDDGAYPVYHGGLEPLGYYDKCNREGDTVMVIDVGASAGTVGYSKSPFWSSDGCYAISHTETFNNRFLYYALLNKQKELVSKVRHAGIPTLDAKVVEQILIPVPSLAEQERIVNILDKFDQLVNGVKDSIPELIDKVQKQYEFYRNKLLTFPEA